MRRAKGAAIDTGAGEAPDPIATRDEAPSDCVHRRRHLARSRLARLSSILWGVRLTARTVVFQAAGAGAAPVRPSMRRCSSVHQSARLRIGWSGVGIPPAAPPLRVAQPARAPARHAGGRGIEALRGDQHQAVVKQQTRSALGAVGESPCACNSRQPDHTPLWWNSRHAGLKPRCAVTRVRVQLA